MPAPELPDHRPQVDHEPVLHPDLSSSGRLVVGGRQVAPRTRRYLAPYQWDMLASVAAAPDTWTLGEPLPIVAALAAQGLLTLTSEPDRHVVSVTEAGRDALRRGWYDVDDS